MVNRYLKALIIFLFTALLVGCGGETTRVDSSSIGLAANLPGKGWTEVTMADGSGYVADLWTVSDKHVLYSPGYLTDFNPKGNTEMGAYINGFAEGAFGPPVTLTQVDFHSYPSYRIEGVSSNTGLASDYRFKGYFFNARDRLFFVMASATVESWESTGEKEVDAILDAVEITR